MRIDCEGAPRDLGLDRARIRRDRFLGHRRRLRLHVVLRQLETLMPRFVERPEPIRRQLSARREQRRFAHGLLECFQRATVVAGHEKAKAIELRQALRENVTSFFFQVAKLQAAFAPRKSTLRENAQ